MDQYQKARTEKSADTACQPHAARAPTAHVVHVSPNGKMAHYIKHALEALQVHKTRFHSSAFTVSARDGIVEAHRRR